MIEKKLKRQGIHVLPYKLLVGNIKEMNKLASEARSKPMELSHDIATLLNPMLQKLAMTYKKPIAIWHGTVPCVVIMNPKLIKDIMTRKFEFQKPEVSPTMKFFLKGLSNIDGDKWAMHRKIINPAFHMEKLKGMLPSFMVCCEEMVEKWDKLLSSANSCELDVLPEFQNLTGDIISRAAFGCTHQHLLLDLYQKTQLGEYSLPAGVNLTIPLYLVQRDPELWGENAMEFNPERFSDGFTKPFFSFGWGPRICIGQNFAMLEAKLALAMILQHFSFELSPTYRHAPYVALTLQPQFGAQIVLRKI
ncbi:hypothetical protein GH714_010480 [Hevea brasiliensis]|uniref:Cytochrome P450 n=1 Tax=Hevea brasiliensis TaxID=3981 RepID=A0A6A6K437_HEVBR|nr:hypothetical protein GH714_010480 [Hevea brasiliensis]